MLTWNYKKYLMNIELNKHWHVKRFFGQNSEKELKDDRW